MLKKIVYIIIIAVSLCILAYGAYVLYEVVMSDVELRIKKAVAEGIKEGLLGSVNPLNWLEQYARQTEG